MMSMGSRCENVSGKIMRMHTMGKVAIITMVLLTAIHLPGLPEKVGTG